MKVYFDLVEEELGAIHNREYLLFKSDSREKSIFNLYYKTRRSSEPQLLANSVVVVFEYGDVFLPLRENSNFPKPFKGRFLSFFYNKDSYYEIARNLSSEKFFKILSSIRDFHFVMKYDPEYATWFDKSRQTDIRGHLLSREFRYLRDKEFDKIVSFFNEGRVRRRMVEVLEVQMNLLGMEPTWINLRVKVDSISSSNLFCVIGKNGVGKTQLLRSIRRGSIEEFNFSRVISVNLENRRSAKSITPGWTDLNVKQNSKSPIAPLLIRLKELSTHVYFFDRLKLLKRFLDSILRGGGLFIYMKGNYFDLAPEELVGIRDSDLLFYRKNGNDLLLSQGQEYIIRLFLNLLVVIEDESIVLFDEPEVYLHPNYIVALMRHLQFLFKSTSSIGIISTHSVFVVRELAKEYVYYLRNSGNEVVLSNPKRETFGGSLDRLAEEIFSDEDEETRFEEELKKGKLRNVSHILPSDIRSRLG